MNYSIVFVSCILVFIMGNTFINSRPQNDNSNREYFQRKFNSENLWDDQIFYETFQKSWESKGYILHFSNCVKDIIKKHNDLEASFENYGSNREILINNFKTKEQYVVYEMTKIFMILLVAVVLNNFLIYRL